MSRFSLLLVLSGCGAVTLEGRVVAEPGADAPAAGVTVELLDGDFAVVDETVVGDDGSFALTTPTSGFVHLVVSGEGHVPVSHPGESGQSSPYVVPDGEIFALPEAVAAAWRGAFAGCPGADGSAPMIVGEIRAPLTSDSFPDGPPWPNSFAFRSDLDDADAGRVDACYQDDDGLADPERNRTGDLGRFGVFGVPSGPGVVSVGQDTTAGTLVAQFPVWVPADGAILLLPAYIPL